jgi:hypothetical protein
VVVGAGAASVGAVATTVTLNTTPTKNSGSIIAQCPTSSLTEQAQQEIQDLINNGKNGGTTPGKIDSSDPEALSKGHAAARQEAKANGTDARTDPRYGGNCDPNQYDKLDQAQKDACKPGGCNGLSKHNSDQLVEIYNKISIWEQCRNARENIAEQCFAGGDDGHKKAIAQAQATADNCRDLLK